MSVLDLQTIRYINLLDNASRVKTRKCFVYNNTIFFAVPRTLVAKAIGPNAAHIHYIQDQLGKRIKIIREAEGVSDAARFVQDIVAPVSFKSLEVVQNTFVLQSSGLQSKAALIGRNRRRHEELNRILEDTFNIGLKIV